MASSRHMRRPGLPSLKPPSSDRNRFISADETSPSPQSPAWNEWTEPPERQPVPSFEDYKGLERHGVLEHMAPLGQLPNSKVKARIRQYEPSRRTTLSRHEDMRTPGGEISTPEPNFDPRRPMLQHEVPQSNLSSVRLQNDLQGGSVPVPPSIVLAPDAPTVQMQDRSTLLIPAPAFPSVPTPSDMSQYQRIVDWAIQRSEQAGKRTLGVAIQKLYEQSLYDVEYAELLVAVINQNATNEQFSHFGKFLKAARRVAKREERKRPLYGQKVSASYSKLDVAHPLHLPGETLDTNILDPAMLEASKSLQSRWPSSTALSNGSPTRKGPPSKRAKPSLSVSSASPLSEPNFDIEELAPDKYDHGTNKGGIPTGLNDPFSMDVLGREQDSSEDSPEKRLAARRRLDRALGMTPDANNIQSPISSLRKSTLPPTALQDRAQQPRRQGLGSRQTPQRHERASSDSTLSSSLDVPPPPSLSTHGITPQLGRPPRGGKRVARIKQSPIKKRNGVTAGLAPPAEAELTQVNIGRSDENLSEPEICSACGGNGSLVLCDGCPRGFHFTCCDPPLHPETHKDELPEQWFCRRCSSYNTGQADKDSHKTSGIWTELKTLMKARNPTAFSLPQQIKEHFEGVTVGEEGEYEELHNVKISKARSGYDEVPDNLKLKDRKDQTILCFRCGSSANGKREIVPCDYCNLGWHLDCVDPPLASAPNKKAINGRPRQTWMCPNHADHELINMTAFTSNNGRRAIHKPSSAQPQEDRRVFHVRRPKHPMIVNIALRRGFRNSGLIEIDQDESDEESEIERELSGVIHKVPERGIKLDFIDRIRRAGFERQAYQENCMPQSRRRRKISTQRAEPAEPGSLQSPPVRELDDFDKRPFRERKAALNLAQLTHDNVELSSDQVANLIRTLTAEAPSAVESMLLDNEKASITSRGYLPPVDRQERKDLEALISLARQRLGYGPT